MVGVGSLVSEELDGFGPYVKMSREAFLADTVMSK